MVTADEIGSIAIFAGLSEADRERLARATADITLAPGEYAAHEGGERALFAVLAGTIEAVKLVDGIPRVVGERQVGELFGEVPIALGTVFPVGFRAGAEPTRVLRIEPNDYHAVASVQPDIAKEVGKLAANRMSGPRGLQGIAAEPPPPRALVVGHRLDPYCTDLRHFLDRNQISFRWISPDAADAEEEWGGPVPAADDCPAIRMVDGKTVFRPELRRVAELLGLATEPAAAEYDAVIVGAGPAGLAAAVYGASEGLRTIVIEREAPGGQAGTSSRIENYLGFPVGRVRGRARQPGPAAGVAARRGGAGDADDHADRRGDAAGAPRRRRRPARADDHPRLRGRVAAAANRGVRAARREGDLLRRRAQRRSGRPRARRPHRRRRQLRRAGGDALLQPRTERHAALPRRDAREEHVALPDRAARGALEHRDALPDGGRGRARRRGARGDRGPQRRERARPSGSSRTASSSSSAPTPRPAGCRRRSRSTETATCSPAPTCAQAGRWELERDPYLLETSVPGIFASGDVRYGPVKRVAAAVGEGSMAIAFVHQYLKEP